MTFDTADLTPLLVRAPDAQGLRYGQGKLVTWDVDTFANTVAWRGTILHDVPVLAGPAALTFAPGQVVALIGWAPGGGAGSWAILGQWISPGTAASEQAIAFMKGTLGRAVSAEVFADRVHSASVDAEVETASTSYVALTGGPSLSDVEVSDSGKMVVMVGAEIILSSQASASQDQAGAMSFEISGASSVAAADANAKLLGLIVITADGLIHDRSMAVSTITGLNAGLHTVEARYRRFFGDGNIPFRRRTLVAIGT